MANKESKNFATKQAILRPCSHSYTSKLYWLMSNWLTKFGRLGMLTKQTIKWLGWRGGL